MKAEEFFIKEWGTGFHDAILKSDKGLLEMSMQDIYETMEKYREEAEREAFEAGRKKKMISKYSSRFPNTQDLYKDYKDYKSKK